IKRLKIGGRDFWRSEIQTKSLAGKMQTITFAASLNDYILELKIISFDSKLTDQLRHNIEAMTFFDPSTAREMAGPDSQPYGWPRSSTSTTPVNSRKDMEKISQGVISGNTYKNEPLGFEYKLPSGWISADRATQEKVL